MEDHHGRLSPAVDLAKPSPGIMRHGKSQVLWGPDSPTGGLHVCKNKISRPPVRAGFASSSVGQWAPLVVALS